MRSRHGTPITPISSRLMSNHQNNNIINNNNNNNHTTANNVITIPVDTASYINNIDNNDVDDLSKLHVKTLSNSDICINLALRIKNHPYTMLIYILLMIFNIIAVILQYIYNINHWFVIFVEILLNTTLAVEVIINIIAQKRQFFSYISNIIDFVLTILCTLLAIWFMYDEYIMSNDNDTDTDIIKNKTVNNTDEVLSELDNVLMSLRYLYQIGRFASYIRRSKTASDRIINNKDDDISFLKQYKYTNSVNDEIDNMLNGSNSHTINSINSNNTSILPSTMLSKPLV